MFLKLVKYKKNKIVDYIFKGNGIIQQLFVINVNLNI